MKFNALTRLTCTISFGVVLASAAAQPLQLETLPGDEFGGTLAKTGSLYIAGQPTEAGLTRLGERGVKTVINIRTPQEMEDRERVPFDEAATARALGLDYINLPSGGEDYPYSPETLARFADAMSAAEGDVLLHCASARRATQLWVAWLVKYRDVPLHTAIARGRSINFPKPPLEGYLDGEIEYRLTEANP